MLYTVCPLGFSQEAPVLLAVRSFQDEERELNRTTLCWPQQLDPIFEENERVRPHHDLLTTPLISLSLRF